MLQDYIILDEGHKIKNFSNTTEALYQVTAKNCLVLTGTPIMNDLKVKILMFIYNNNAILKK